MDSTLIQRQRRDSHERSLSPFAATSATSRGRERTEPEGPESPFAIDRERIVRSKAFRRLMHKTQVFMAPQGDHYLTRLTHTMEVSLIARGIARGLNLNEDLAEAMCMGHDVGHSLFGHLGEKALAELYPGGFRHNRQSVRVVELLENDGRGLNLTWEVRQGILKHSKGRGGIEGNATAEMDTLEAQVCKLADALAYICHDSDDAIRAAVLAPGDIPASITSVLGTARDFWGDTFVADIVRESWACTGLVATPHGEKPFIHMSRPVSAAANALRDFLFERVYEPASGGPQAQQAIEIVGVLYRYFARHADLVPEGYSLVGEPPERIALDYVSGMTDSYALTVVEELRPGITSGFRQSGPLLRVPQVRG